MRYVIIAIFILLATNVLAQGSENIVGEAEINVFGGKIKAGTAYGDKVLIKAPAGAKVQLFDFYEKPYFKVKYDTLVGFISSAFLVEDEIIKEFRIRDIHKKNPKLAKLLRKYPQSVAEKLLNRKLWVGMSRQMVLDSWGAPDDKNITENIYGRSEQWIYKKGNYDYNYVYIEEGKVTTIQY